MGDLEDNVIEFPKVVSVNDDDMVEINLSEMGIAHAFNSIRITVTGLLNDNMVETDMADCVHGCIMAVSWMAKEAGVTKEELSDFFSSIEIDDLGDEDGEKS